MPAFRKTIYTVMESICCFFIGCNGTLFLVVPLLFRYMRHTVQEAFLILKTHVKDNHGWICSFPLFVDRMYTVVYTVNAISPALCDLLIVLRETEGGSTMQIHAVNLR
jgi:hypothetical protein